jgi:hypothetical protein
MMKNWSKLGFEAKMSRSSVMDKNSMMGGVDMSDAYLLSYRSTRKRLKKYYQKHFCHLIYIYCLNSYFLHEKQQAK